MIYEVNTFIYHTSYIIHHISYRPIMSSREKIIGRIRQLNLTPLPLPEVPLFNETQDELIARFNDVLTFVGGRLRVLSDGETLENVLQQSYPDAEQIASSVPLAGFTLVPIDTTTDKPTLEAIDLAVLKGEFGVAENSAVWLPEPNMLHRALPFITQHLVLVISKKELVLTMHEAYQRIDRQSLSYGVFIAGPSKTADIEQSLVICAHGARSLLVVATA